LPTFAVAATEVSAKDAAKKAALTNFLPVNLIMPVS